MSNENMTPSITKTRTLSEKRIAWLKEYRIKNRERKDTKLKKYYGITLAEYKKLLEIQKSVCAICKNVETMIDSRNGRSRALAVDHNHKTGKVRGLLCRKCNNGIGIFNEDINLLESIKLYLKSYE